MKKTINIVIPLYNEGENIRQIHKEIQQIFQQKSVENYQYSIIFVNDGSTDNSLNILKELQNQYAEVKFISFSKNFGHQLAVKAGLDHALGDAVISMDCDLQHPPELIPELIKKWEEGYKVVGTIREYPPQISYKKQKSSKYFYQLINLISDVEIRNGTADFRLLDQSVVEVIRTMDEDEPFLRGIVPWVGFKQIYISYMAQSRFWGQSKYTLKKMLSLALTGVTSFSVKPLYFAVYVGFLFSALSLLYIPYVLWSVINGTGVSGWTSLIMTIVFFGGMNLSFLGILGIYIGKIFKQSRKRPNYIIEMKNL